jgi:hypothetical protein
MATWEYTIVELAQDESTAELKWSIDLPEGTGERQMLARLGGEGWELAAISQSQRNAPDVRTQSLTTYYFKRQEGTQLP